MVKVVVLVVPPVVKQRVALLGVPRLLPRRVRRMRHRGLRGGRLVRGWGRWEWLLGCCEGGRRDEGEGEVVIGNGVLETGCGVAWYLRYEIRAMILESFGIRLYVCFIGYRI